MTKPIPLQSLPRESMRPGEDCGEPFVDISAYSRGRILVDMQYYRQGRPGAISTAYLRRTVADMLLRAADRLPSGCRFLIYDAWRPFSVQKNLYDEFFATVSRQNPGLPREELHRLTQTFVSRPDPDTAFSYVHSSGGAIDLTLADSNGEPLDMGTAFDDFTEKAAAASLEQLPCPSQAQSNRRLLYHSMVSAGFTSYPEEWWHFDYGDLFWSAMTGQAAKYASVYSTDDMILV